MLLCGTELLGDRAIPWAWICFSKQAIHLHPGSELQASTKAHLSARRPAVVQPRPLASTREGGSGSQSGQSGWGPLLGPPVSASNSGCNLETAPFRFTVRGRHLMARRRIPPGFSATLTGAAALSELQPVSRYRGTVGGPFSSRLDRDAFRAGARLEQSPKEMLLARHGGAHL